MVIFKDDTMPINRLAAASVVFIESMCVLILEILSVRLLAPYVGLTLETTTSIIGAVLLGISLGAGVGGRIADRTNPRKLVVVLLVAGGLLSLSIVAIVRWLGPTALNYGIPGALRVTFIALVPSAAILSAISPTIARLQLSDLRHSGSVVGSLSGWATAGALFGTFVTGFILVPLFPVSTCVFAVGILLIVTAAIFTVFMQVFSIKTITCVALVTVMMGLAGLLLPKPCQAETSYHCVNVTTVQGYKFGRYLYLDTDRNSFIDLKDPSDLGTFHYSHWIAGVIENYRPRIPINMLVIGGGAFTLPRWLQAVRPGSKSTTLEVDKQLITFDKHYLGLRTNKNLRVVGGDARLTIHHQSTGSMDVVIGDAFSGLTVPWQLMTEEFIREVRRVLKPGGFYAINMIDFPPLSLLRAEIATILSQFGYVEVITKSDGKSGLPSGGNSVILASNVELPASRSGSLAGVSTVRYDRISTAEIAAGWSVLTDNYAPVEQLQTR